MAKLEQYLRSIEKFQATGAILSSGQAIVLKFPGGDRAATQVTPHDQLVAMVREVAPPAALAQIDASRPARFELERYSVSVAARPGAWQVTIETVDAPAIDEGGGGDMSIERGQYDGPAIGIIGAAPASGSAVLDQLTRSARGARANDIFLTAGMAPQQRVAGELTQLGAPMDAESISRELGLIAPPEARAAWTEGDGHAVFAYGDGLGRVRVTLGRDRRGPTATLRLLPEEPPTLDRLNLAQTAQWLDGGGLILVAGPSGVGKTIVFAALVKTLGDRGRRVVAIEDPIELVQGGDTISQREVGVHVASVAAGIAAGVAEGADVIAVGAVREADAVRAVASAVAAGHLVLATVNAPAANEALNRVLAHLAGDDRDSARHVLSGSLIGVIRPTVSREGRRYEVVPGNRPGV
jgi:twitching motility protein PilT